MEINDKIWKILDKYKLEISSQISDFVKCLICGNLLIDAYIGLCGCNYCKRCIESWLNLEHKFCPGGLDSCKSENSRTINGNIFKDFGSDIRLLALEVKCPLESCNFRCKLSQLDRHLELCEKSIIDCPFIKIGCDSKSLDKDIVTEHLLTEIESHCKLYIKIMEDIKGEKSKLDMKLNNSVTENDLNDFIYSVDFKFNEIKSMNEDRKNKYEVDLENVNNKVQEIKTRNKTLTDSIEKIQENCDNEIRKLKIIDKKQKQEISKLKKLYSEIPNSLIQTTGKEEYSNCQFSINWSTDDITLTQSHPFYSVDKRYKVGLFIFPYGCFFDCYQENGVCFQFVIANNQSQAVNWEFQGIIKITIINKNYPLESVIVTRHCKFTETFNREIIHFTRSFNNLFKNLKPHKIMLINCTVDLMK